MALNEESLIGYTIVGFELVDDGEYEWPRLILYREDAEQHTLVVEVSRDEEGNGPGCLFVGEPDDFEEDDD